jgi:bifunctional DNase/RNase
LAEIEVKIDSVRQGTLSKGSTLMLKGKRAECYLPIYIGKEQALRIQELLMGIPLSKPLNNSLVDKILENAELTSVVINKFDGKEFHTKLRCKHDNKTRHHGIQLTEAIIASLRTGVPILVDKKVLTKSGITM